MLLFFICWLYLIPSLLFPLTEQGGSYSSPNLNHFFWLSGIGPHLHGGVCSATLPVHIYASFVWSPLGLLVGC